MKGLQYESQKVLSASPMELILMLYDGGLRSLEWALDAFGEPDELKRMQAINTHLLKAQSYITELACSLDIEQGGEMARSIEQIYEFMINHLINANTSGSRKPVEEVRSMLADLRDGWRQAMDALPRDQTPEPVAVERTSSFNFSG